MLIGRLPADGVIDVDDAVDGRRFCGKWFFVPEMCAGDNQNSDVMCLRLRDYGLVADWVFFCVPECSKLWWPQHDVPNKCATWFEWLTNGFQSPPNDDQLNLFATQQLTYAQTHSRIGTGWGRSVMYNLYVLECSNRYWDLGLVNGWIGLYTLVSRSEQHSVYAADKWANSKDTRT